jgi:hypothetical protein
MKNSIIAVLLFICVLITLILSIEAIKIEILSKHLNFKKK